MRPFFVTGPPRSRTAWLANLLTYGPAFCLHEPLRYAPSGKALRGTLASLGVEHPGAADGSLGLLGPDLTETFPAAPLVFIHRDPLASEQRFLLAVNDSSRQMREGWKRAWTTFATLSDTWTGIRLDVPYPRLDDLETVEAIWRLCVPTAPFNAERWRMLRRLKVTVHEKRMLDDLTPEAAELAGAGAAHAGR